MIEERAFDMRKQATLCLQYFINHKDFFPSERWFDGHGGECKNVRVSILSLLSSSLDYHFSRDIIFEGCNVHLSHLFQL